MEMYKNLEVMVQGAFRLSGTLTIPNEERTVFPAVLIIAGSGKGDRDGNIKKLKPNMYKDLAEFLTDKGFITLRYDKRGTYNSEGNFLETGLSDLIDDAVACTKFLQNHPNVDKEKLFILGHSEGALIAPAVHQKIPVSGLILLAGAAGPNSALLPMQTEMAYAEMNQAKGLKGWIVRKLRVTEKARKQNQKLFAKIAASQKDVMRVQGVRMNAKWLRETINYDVRDYLQDVTCPVLAATGEKDVQVPPEDAERIAQLVQGEAEWKIIPNMNHILRPYEGYHTMLGIMKEYKSLVEQPICEELLLTIEIWLRKYN